jgi:carbohydrate kinase (thermoresistant glucokinase family)
MPDVADELSPIRVCVMGVAGSGKTTVGTLLAARLGVSFVDADSMHSAANVAKMAAGEALVDGDRWPWLARLRQQLRAGDGAVVTCSALQRSYRDMLRHADGARFVFLDIDPGTARERADAREGHFMSAAMVAGQFDALERPDVDERDVLVVDATAPVDVLVERIVGALRDIRPGLGTAPLMADGGVDRDITAAELSDHLRHIVRDGVLPLRARRVLLVPPDQTRLHSRAGFITAVLLRLLEAEGIEVGVLPALGTHVAMDETDAASMFGDVVPAGRLLRHDWRRGLHTLGDISAEEVGVVTDGRFAEPIPVAVAAQLFDGWDLVISVGQVVPHEVIGMANFTKNVVIGLGGAPTIHRSHFVGAVAGMESIMGRASSAVRDVVDAAFDRFVDPLLSVLWVLTVVEDVGDRMAQRGMFVGAGGTMASGGAAFRAAAALAQRVNVTVVDEPVRRVVCWLDPTEFRSTWLGNKAIYRTRMAIADGGELVILAPGVQRFGEDELIDGLIRRHGYRGTPAALNAVRADPELAANLGAAAHLIHGSSEGRFRVVWCTDPATGGLSRAEVEGVGYEWRSAPDEMRRLGVDGSTPTGNRRAADDEFYFVANAAMGLWSTAARLD